MMRYTIATALLVLLPVAQAEQPPVQITLSQAISMALAHNHKVELSHLAVRSSEEGKRASESHYFPVIKNDSAVHHITELQGIVLPAGVFSSTAAGLVPAQTLRIDQGASTSYTSGTSLEQPFTQLIRVHAGVRAADAALHASELEDTDTLNATALVVEQLYYNLLITGQNAGAAADATKAAAVEEDDTAQGVRDGRQLVDAELRTRAELLDKQRGELVLKLQLDDLTLQMDDALGVPIGTPLTLDASALIPAPKLPARAEAVELVLATSPQVLEAERGVDKARAGVVSARTAYIPDITGIAKYDYQNGVPFLEHNFGLFGASLSWTVFDGGEREDNLRSAKTSLSMAQTQLEQTRNDAVISIASAYDQVEQLEALVKVSELSLNAAEENYRVTAKREQVSAALPSATAQALAGLSSSKAGLYAARLNLIYAQQHILKLLGKLPN